MSIEQKINLNTPVQYIKGVGPKAAEKLKKLGIFVIRDLLNHFPRNYINFSRPQSIKSTKIGELALVKGEVIDIKAGRTKFKQMNILEFLLSDDSGEIKIIYFNQPYLKNFFKKGQSYSFWGKVSFDFNSRQKSLNSPEYSYSAEIRPVYPETAKITSAYLKKIVASIIPLADDIEDFLPNEVRLSQNILSPTEAIKKIHKPKDMADVDLARRRIVFEELFLNALWAAKIREENKGKLAPKIEIDDKELQKFATSLPFKLTDGQRKAAWRILLDLRGNNKEGDTHRNINLKNTIPPMNRLLNGDVGSGKTVVAAIAAFATVKSGFRVVFLAPTEILAKQHWVSLNNLFQKFNIKVSLWTASQKNDEFLISNVKKSIKKLQAKKLPANKLTSDIIVGTHALLYLKDPIEKLGLVVVDEQHRFGVNQRAELKKLSENKVESDIKSRKLQATCLPTGTASYKLQANTFPHFLSLTATPIPRTLQLALYGDLDISILDEMPKDRKEIITKVVAENERSKTYDFIRQEIKKGRQAFVVCPLIEENQKSDRVQNLFDLDKKSVVKEYEKLSKEIYSDLKIGMLHGKMKDKNEVMKDFSEGKYQILVSTSVVEVGVDIPNASVMMIEDADRFGLSQLHQFRGRVGRASHQSYCFLMTKNQNEKSLTRLSAMEKYASGFKLSEIDLEMRGPGQVFGTMQSGYSELRFEWLSNLELISDAKNEAEQTLQKDPDLEKFPVLKKKLEEKFVEVHLE